MNSNNDYITQNHNITKGFATANSELSLINCRPNFHRFLGVKNKHQSLYNLIKPDDIPAFKEEMAKINEKGYINFITNITRADNCSRRVSLKISLADNTSDEECSYSVELLDLYNIHDYVYRLELTAIKYKKMLENYGNMLFEYNALTDIINIFSVTATTEEIMLSEKLSDLMANSQINPDDKATFDMLCKSLQSRETCFEYIFKENPFNYDHQDSSVVINGRSISLDSGTYLLVGSINQYSKELNHAEYTSNIKNLDMMTGLLSKKAILDFTKNVIDNKKFNQIFLIMFDLDNFKMINDNYGHMTGDKVIREIADILKRYVGTHGCVGRFGGDEFFACLHNLGGEGDLRAILDAISTEILEYYKDKFDGFNVSASIGISEFPRNGNSFDLLFKKADRAVYIAKKKGKKRYIIYKEHLHGDIDLNSDNEDYVLNLDTGKFAGDIKRYKIVKNGISRLLTQGNNAIDNFIEEIIDAYGLTGVSLYSGDDFRLTKQWGNYSNPMPYANYMKLKAGINRFNSKNIFWENNVQANSFYVPIIHDKLLSHNIHSTVQCMIGELPGIRGIMTFDLEQNTRNWIEEDTSYFGIISQLIGQLML